MAIAKRFQVETSKRQNRRDWAREAAMRIREAAIKALPEDLQKEAEWTGARHLAAARKFPPNLPKTKWQAMVLK